jgi:hypothetical protein
MGSYIRSIMEWVEWLLTLTSEPRIHWGSLVKSRLGVWLNRSHSQLRALYVGRPDFAIPCRRLCQSAGLGWLCRARS